MCINFAPDIPDPIPPPPAKKPDPVIDTALPKPKVLVTPDDVAKVDYGRQRKKQRDRPKVSADDLKINLGEASTDPSANTGGINNATS